MKRLLVVLFFLLGFFILVGCENDYNDDYVVIRDINGEIVKGKEDMDAFYERTKEGEKIRINYIDKYLEEGVERTYTFYIEYDGFYYVTNYQMYTNSPEKTKYKYLIYSEKEWIEGNNIEKSEYYCLANNENHTYQVVMNSYFSAIMENHILDAMPFYSYNYYKDGFKVGSYTSKVSLDGTGSMPTITFQNFHEYCLTYSVLSSVIDFGEYEIIDGYVYLIHNSGKYNQEIRLAFKIKQNEIIFDLQKSNVDVWNFSDGTVFYYIDNYSDEEKYKLNVIDNHNILLEPLNDEYKPGEIVKVKLRFFSGLRAGIKVNDLFIETPVGVDDSGCPVYEFIMPNEEVTLYTTINGYTE